MPSIASRALSAAASGVVWASDHAPTALPLVRRMGARVDDQRRRVQDSPNYRDGRVRAHDETREEFMPEAEGPGGAPVAAFRERGKGRPERAVPIATPVWPTEAADLAVTWLGHASSLVELDGHRFLLDPVFGERVSPSSYVGPKRLHLCPTDVESLPPLDAVVISHDHYDHLDEPTIRELEQTRRPVFVVPLGVDAHLEAWGIDPSRIVALDWRESTTVGSVTLTCTETRHFSGRGLVRDQTLWAAWALRGPKHSAYFAGDTGPTHRFELIGRELGPFDLTIVPIGAYNDMWPDIHVTPEQGIDVHLAVTGGAGDASRAMLPIHWATFNLAMHWWSEPIRRARRDAERRGVPLLCPKPGQRVNLGSGSATEVGAAVAAVSDDWWGAVAQSDDHD